MSCLPPLEEAINVIMSFWGVNLFWVGVSGTVTS